MSALNVILTLTVDLK